MICPNCNHQWNKPHVRKIGWDTNAAISLTKKLGPEFQRYDLMALWADPNATGATAWIWLVKNKIIERSRYNTYWRLRKEAERKSL